MLEQVAALMEQEATAGKKVKEAQKVLNAKVAARYGALTEAEVKTLVVEDKWLAALAAALHGELDAVSQQLTRRVKELAERYAILMPALGDRVAELEARVNGHLERMGFSWR